MARVSTVLVRQLRQRTGAALSECRKALEACEGDLERAEAQLRQTSFDEGFASSFKNQFLIAMPSLEDENFRQTVSLLCEHNDDGAIGLVINRPTELRLTTMLDQMSVKHGDGDIGDRMVFWGGPVQPERGFVLHHEPGGWESCMRVADNLYITTSRDVLAAIGRGEGPSQYMVTLGYAGWGAGQLESEILQNAWLNTPVDSAILFQVPARTRWQAATRLLGLDVTQLTGVAGHA
jgi:putative transcriptional regulator